MSQRPRLLLLLFALCALITYFNLPSTSPSPTKPTSPLPRPRKFSPFKSPSQFPLQQHDAVAENRMSSSSTTTDDEDQLLGPVYEQKIVAVGDIHGDLSHLTRILRNVKLIDLKGNWIGEDAILVQTGDIVDRGKDTIALYRFFDQLRPQAEKAGGGVVNLLGNHEIMNALGDWRYVTRPDIDSFGGERNRRIAMSTGWIGQTWRTNYSITARIPFTKPFPIPSSLLSPPPSTPLGSSSQEFTKDPLPLPSSSFNPFSHSAISFVHGGITPEYLSALELSKDEGPITKINSIGRSLLYSLLETAASPLSLPRGATEEQKEFWSERGPMWNREYALDEDEAKICERAERACEILGVRHLAMGHTPNFEGILSRCGGTILLIDTGISRAYGGVLSALEIIITLSPSPPQPDDDARSPETTKWIEREVVSAVYTGDKEKETLALNQRVVELPPN